MVKGDDVEEPFAIVVDQWRSPLPSEAFMAGWYKFRDECGAQAVFVTEDTVEIVDRYAEPQPAPVTVNVSDMTIREEEIDGIDMVVIPEKAKNMLLSLGWIPPVELAACPDWSMSKQHPAHEWEGEVRVPGKHMCPGWPSPGPGDA